MSGDGKLRVEYIVECGYCEAFDYPIGKTKKAAAQYLRECGWSLTRRCGWLCPDCTKQQRAT